MTRTRKGETKKNRSRRTEYRRLRDTWTDSRKTHGGRPASYSRRSALTFYCQTYSEWRKAIVYCEKYGAWTIGKDSNGNTTTTRNEWDRIRERCADSCRKWLIEFGLTPSARTRLQVTEETKDEFDVFLSRYTKN